jgi:hypothetical protein
MESPNGRFIYYLRGPHLNDYREGDLWRLDRYTGEETIVHQGVVDFELGAGGVHVLRRDGLDFLQFSTGQVVKICDFKTEIGSGLAVSPDGGRILYTQVQLERDLVLVEGIQ